MRKPNIVKLGLTIDEEIAKEEKPNTMAFDIWFDDTPNLEYRQTAGMHACERLIRTETTYFTAMADLEAAKARGAKEVQFVATLDTRTSKQCREADGSIIPVEEAAPGKNIPPLHPFCRSVIIDVIRGLVHKVRKARDAVTGKNYMVPAEMTYNQWKSLPLAEKQLNIGSVKGITLQKPAKKTILSEDHVQSIKKAIEKVGQDYELKLDYLEIGEYTDEEHIGDPMFYRPVLENGVHKNKVVINTACDFWQDDQYMNSILQSDYWMANDIEEMMYHELAHVLTFQGCNTMREHAMLSREVNPLYHCGVSWYDKDSEDGSETIAEIFVMKYQNKKLDAVSKYILSRYIEKWRK